MYTFHLHDDVTWHDGEPFSAEDVKFTFDMIVEHDGPAGFNLSDMKEVRVEDDTTVVIELENPNAAFLGYLAWYGTFIVAEHVYDDSNWDSGTTIEPIGTGPFVFDEHTSGVSINLLANEEYFGHVPEVPSLVFSITADQDTKMQAFYNGEIDILGTAPPSSEIASLEENEDYVIERRVWPSREYIFF
ncbi:ABC transporter substrate-binding protein [Geomicrobium sp. JCM 19055]|uniref:ABC transporter substrate-binding protein n=1 Tax=Geomicrobium sp. JCM 19055 TaxID=1460649 RepID=UPI00187BEE7B|nr:ABC transporter substrate-binding protein [Geomicrobium sp. JCM 19055]